MLSFKTCCNNIITLNCWEVPPVSNEHAYSLPVIKQQAETKHRHQVLVQSNVSIILYPWLALHTLPSPTYKQTCILKGYVVLSAMQVREAVYTVSQWYSFTWVCCGTELNIETWWVSGGDLPVATELGVSTSLPSDPMISTCPKVQLWQSSVLSLQSLSAVEQLCIHVWVGEKEGPNKIYLNGIS